jgi:hypothetical protein
MKKLIILLILISLNCFGVCENDNFGDLSGTSQIEELISDAIPLSGPPQGLTEVERDLYPYLEKMLMGARGELAAQKVITHFDNNNDGKLSASELDEGFSDSPFNFGYVGRKLGVKTLMSRYGRADFIEISGARSFVQKYGFY